MSSRQHPPDRASRNGVLGCLPRAGRADRYLSRLTSPAARQCLSTSSAELIQLDGINANGASKADNDAVWKHPLSNESVELWEFYPDPRSAVGRELQCISGLNCVKVH